MRTLRIAALALLVASAAGAVHASTSVAAGIHIGPSGRTSVDLGFFYDDLAPYGHWIERPSYGWVWVPRVTVATWRPYLYGHWVWTDDGWVWVSDEPFGWATYHYGRWYDDADYGWEWIPGDEWGPAWVDWQASSDYVGWAPLPPSWSYSRPVRYSLQPAAYVFVPTRSFLAPRVASYAVPIGQSARIFPNTRNYTSYRPYNNTFFNQGVPVTRVQQAIGRPVPRFRVADLPARQWRQGARIARNQVEVFRPQVQRARAESPLSRPIARRSVLAGSAAKALASRRGGQRPAIARQQLRHENRMAPAGRGPRELRQPKALTRELRQNGRPGRQIRQQVRPNRQMHPMQQMSHQKMHQRGMAAQPSRQQAHLQRQVRQQGKALRQASRQSRPGPAMRGMKMNRPNRSVGRQAQAFRAPRAQRQFHAQQQFRAQRQVQPQRQAGPRFRQPSRPARAVRPQVQHGPRVRVQGGGGPARQARRGHGHP